MRLTFYDYNLKKKTVEYTWISLLWDTMYNGVGSFTVEFRAQSGLCDLISETDYVMFDEDKSNTVMVVWSIELRDGAIIVSGESAISIFENRVSDAIVRNKNAELAMRELVENMTPWNCVENGELKELTDKFTAQKSDDTLLNYFLEISQYCDVGIMLRKSGEKLLFECYKPTLNNAVVFDAKFGNINDEKYSRSEKEFRNVAIVAGKANEETGERTTITTGAVEATGLDRRELYVDARDLQIEDDETEAEYEARLAERGEAKLAECVKSSVLEFTLLDDEVSLGDLVLIKPTYLTTAVESRVQYITYKSQKNILQKSIGIGTLIVRK